VSPPSPGVLRKVFYLMVIGLYHSGEAFIKYCIQMDLGSEGDPRAISWVGLWSGEIVKAGTLLNREENGKGTGDGKDKRNSRFLHCGGKCAALGRNDGF
jgi:hypothetical protein